MGVPLFWFNRFCLVAELGKAPLASQFFYGKKVILELIRYYILKTVIICMKCHYRINRKARCY
jgi:hypothetical protein